MIEAGRLLRVNLSSREVSVLNLSSLMVRPLLGGKGLQARILWEETRGVSPWSPGNKLILAPGLLTGLPVPGACLLAWSSKSPATRSYGESFTGGYLGAELRNAGYAAVIIEGVSATPSMLIIDDNRIEICNATNLWGESSLHTEQRLLAELGPDFQVACIGPAGENRVRFATIVHRYGLHRARTGLGAVMGSKKLKAIAIRGTRGIRPLDPRALLYKTREILSRAFGGGPLPIESHAVNPVAPVNNFQSLVPNHGLFSHPGAEEPGVLKACFSCPFPCTRQIRISADGVPGSIEAPGYQATAMLGANCGLSSPADVGRAFYTCISLGLDPVSAGNAVAFAVEASMKGYISRRLLGRGMKYMKYGNPETVLYLLGIITWHDGLGEILAEGVETAARFLGCQELAVQVKGLEWGSWEGGDFPTAVLANMTADIGAGAEGPWAGTPGPVNPVKSVIQGQDRESLLCSLGLCPRTWKHLDLGMLPGLLYAATGMDLGRPELQLVAERAWNLTRAYWIREVPGFGRVFDLPPLRLARLVEHHPELLDRYYQERGWNSRGWPTPGKLEELGLGYVRKDLL